MVAPLPTPATESGWILGRLSFCATGVVRKSHGGRDGEETVNVSNISQPVIEPTYKDMFRITWSRRLYRQERLWEEGLLVWLRGSYRVGEGKER